MVEEEIKESEQRNWACLDIRVKSLAGVSGESGPPSSHLMLTKSSPLDAILSFGYRAGLF